MIFCNFCKKHIHRYVNEFRRHIIRVHGIVFGAPTAANFVCGQEGCIFSFSLYNSLRRHIIRHHPRILSSHETEKALTPAPVPFVVDIDTHQNLVE